MTCPRVPFAAVVTASVSLLAGATAAMAGAAETPPLEGTAWVLAKLPGRTLPAGAFATLRFDRDRVTGHDGCNGFTVPYKAEGGTLQVIFEGPATTMDCPPERTEIAHIFVTALEGARSYKIEGGRLRLLAMGGDVLATLARAAR
jgi:heat shock protein HslJ